MQNEIEWITPDGYHIEDILLRRRCIICGHIANGKNHKTKTGTEYYLCITPSCTEQLHTVLAVLDA